MVFRGTCRVPLYSNAGICALRKKLWRTPLANLSWTANALLEGDPGELVNDVEVDTRYSCESGRSPLNIPLPEVISENLAAEEVDERCLCKFGRSPNDRARDALVRRSNTEVDDASRNHHHPYQYRKRTLKPVDKATPQNHCHRMTSKETPNIRVAPGSQTDAPTHAALLRWCGDTKALSDGKRFHARIIKNGLRVDHFWGSLLIQMYDKCDAVVDALSVFTAMHCRNVFACNFIIRVYVRQGQSQNAVQLFNQMLIEGVLPNQVTYVSILSLYCSQENLVESKRLHTRISDTEYISDIIVGTALVNMYGKCGSLGDALKTFETMPDRNVVSWTALIAAYAQHGETKKAFQVFEQMQHEGFVPTIVSFITMLAACVSQAALSDGKGIHVGIIKSGLESDVRIANALINMYGKWGNLEDAQDMFDKMSQRDVVSWTGMIAVYAQKGMTKEAVKLFKQMQQKAIKPNKVTFVSILAAFSSQASLPAGKRMHKCIVDNGFELDVTVGNALVSMYGKCGSLGSAGRMFRKIPERDVVSWNSIIAAYAEQGNTKGALRLFKQMQKKRVNPDKFTFVSLLAAFTSPAALAEGTKLHAFIRKYGLEQDILVGGALINMYGKCGNPDDARKVFDKMPERDVVTWNSLIAVHTQHGQDEMALKLFHKMQREGIMIDKVTAASILSACASHEALNKGKRLHHFIRKCGYESDEIVGCALINMYGKCGSVGEARRVFDKMPKPNVVSWTAMIGVYAQYRQCMEALQLFDQMQWKGVLPDQVTFIALFAACASQATLSEGRLINACAVDRDIESDVVVGNALINMYGKCGSLKDARSVFDKMPERDIVSWNGMIAVYCNHGHGKEALRFYNLMEREGVMPDKVTFISVLSACSHTGLVDEARNYFNSMNRKHGISPDLDHYVCMIDLLGRAGLLDEAEHLIHGMPFQPSGVPFMALLCACQYRSDLKRGERAANHVFELDPENSAPYVCLSNIYAAAGRDDDAAKVLQRMRDRGLRQ